MTPAALDITIGLIIFLSVLIAYWRGLIKEVFLLAGLGLAVFSAYKGGHLLVPGLNKLFGVPLEGVDEKAEPILGILAPHLAAKVVAYGGTFLLVFLLTTLLGFLITRLIKEMGLGVVDRLLGAGFGFLRGFLLVFLLYVPISYLIADQEKFPAWAKESVSVPVLQSTLDWANKKFELDKMIEDQGDGIAVKFDKIDPEKFGEAVKTAEEKLKEAVAKEEEEVQKEEPEEDKLPSWEDFGTTAPPDTPAP